MANSSVSVFAGAGDGYVRKYGGAWSGLVATGSVTGNDAYPTATADYCCVCENTNPMNGRGFFPFDLSSAGIPSGSVITGLTLYVYVTAKGSAGGGTTANNSVSVVRGTPASNTTLATTDFGNAGSTEWVAARTAFSAFTTSAYNSFTLNTSAVTQANADIAGYFVAALRGGYDLDNVAPTGNSNIQTRFSEYSGTSNDPYLVVEYSAPRTTSDAWAWSDATTGVDTTVSGVKTLKRTGQYDAWAWSDSAARYRRALRQPVLVAAAGDETTLGAAQNGANATINVVSTTGFPSSGTFIMVDQTDLTTQRRITYTGTTGTSFTGCSGGLSATYPSTTNVVEEDCGSRFPVVIELDETATPALLYINSVSPGHGAALGTRSVGRTSTDGGDTWSAAFDTGGAKQGDDTYSAKLMGAVRLLNGRLLGFRYEASYSGPLKTYLTYSDDNGTTWSTPVRLTSPFDTDSCVPGFQPLLYTGSGSNATYGDVYINAYGITTGSQGSLYYPRLLKITDGGAGGTWTSVSIVATNAQMAAAQTAAGVPAWQATGASSEASVIELADGTWLTHIRGQDCNNRYQAFSSDLGVTWTGHELAVASLMNKPNLIRMPSGHLITQGQAVSGAPTTYVSTDSAGSWLVDGTEYSRSPWLYNVGSGLTILTDTTLPYRRVVNAWANEALTQAGAEAYFQWYEPETFPLLYDTWLWSDAATRSAQTFTRTTAYDHGSEGVYDQVWLWSDSTVGVIEPMSRTTSDAWAWSDSVATADQVFARTTSDAWTWSSSVSGSVGPIMDTWSWADIATVSTTISGAAGTPGFWIQSVVGAEVVIDGVVDASLTFTAVV